MPPKKNPDICINKFKDDKSKYCTNCKSKGKYKCLQPGAYDNNCIVSTNIDYKDTTNKNNEINNAEKIINDDKNNEDKKNDSSINNSCNSIQDDGSVNINCDEEMVNSPDYNKNNKRTYKRKNQDENNNQPARKSTRARKKPKVHDPSTKNKIAKGLPVIGVDLGGKITNKINERLFNDWIQQIVTR